MYRIAIVDDEQTSVEIIRNVMKGIVEQYTHIYNIDGFNSIAEFKRAKKERRYDLLLLDIDLAGEDGIAFADALQKEKSGLIVVFVSNREDLVFDAFKTHAFGFIRKRCFFEDISILTISIFIQQDETAENPQNVIFTVGTRKISLPVRNIIYVESIGSKQYVHISDKENAITINESLTLLEEKLEPHGFLKIYRSYIVNFRFIREIGNTEVVLTTGKSLPVSRQYRKEIMTKYMKMVASTGSVVS